MKTKLAILTAAAAMLAGNASAADLYLSSTASGQPFLNANTNWSAANWGTDPTTGGTYGNWSNGNTAVFQQLGSNVASVVTLDQNVTTTGLTNTHTFNSADMEIRGDVAGRQLIVNGNIDTTLASTNRVLKVGVNVDFLGTYTKTGTAGLNFVSSANLNIGGNMTIANGQVAINNGANVNQANESNALKINITGGSLYLPTNVNVAGGGFAELKGSAGTIYGTGSITLNSWTVNQTTNTTLASAITGGGSGYTSGRAVITKEGAGTLILSGNNVGMTGSTAAVGNSVIVSGGVLLGGSANAFGGSGTNNNVSVGAAGTIGSTGGATVLVGNNLSLASGAKFSFDLTGGATKLDVAGDQLGAFNFTVDLSGLSSAGSYTLMTVAGGTIEATGFTQGTLNGGFTWTSLGLVGNDLVGVVAVPEPAAWLLTAGSLTALMVFRRRRME